MSCHATCSESLEAPNAIDGGRGAAEGELPRLAPAARRVRGRARRPRWLQKPRGGGEAAGRRGSRLRVHPRLRTYNACGGTADPQSCRTARRRPKCAAAPPSRHVPPLKVTPRKAGFAWLDTVIGIDATRRPDCRRQDTSPEKHPPEKGLSSRTQLRPRPPVSYLMLGAAGCKPPSCCS